MNLRPNDIKKRNLKGGEVVKTAEYRPIELPRGQKGLAIYVKVDGESKMRPTNMLEIDGSNVWADSMFTRFCQHELNQAERRAYELANL